MKLFISFIILFCFSLFLINECDGHNKSYGLKKKWYFNDEEDYDESHNIYASSSNYIGMKINPNTKNILKAPILLVAEKPIDNVIVTKVLPHMAKPIKNKLYNGVSYKNQRNPYNTLPGTYTKRSYAGEIINYGKKYDRPQDLYRTYLSSNSYHVYNQYCTKSYGQKKTISKKDLDQAFAYALAEVKGYKNKEKRMEFQGGFMNVSGPYSSTARHQISTYLNQQDSEGTEEKEAFLMEFASKFLNKYKCLNKYDTHFILPNLRIHQRPMKNSKCNFSYSQDGAKNSVDCREFVNSKFRSPDGSCNNLKHPFWGKSSVCHIRLVASAYEDGISEPRQNSFKYGRKLPTARHVSQAAHYEKPDRFFYTLMVMAFGQFLNHDITFTPQTKLESKDSIIDCCKKVPGNKKAKVHPQCMPILLPSNDYQTIVHKKSCMNFVRSAPCPLCNLGPREQVNQVTSFIDLSTVYGSDLEEQKKLRTFKGGILKFSRNRFGNVILPKSESQDQCSSKLNSQFCFVAGDVRVNQQPILQAYHLLYLRSHNIFASNLAKVNPNWSDERLFQEARRLNIAIYQHITYEEYLPLIFGPTLNSFYNINSDGYETYSKYDLNSKSQHYKKNLFTIYEPKTDPTTWNDYATAACRYGHSLISSFYNLIGGSGYNGSNYTLPHGSNKPGYWLRDVFFSSSLLHEGQLDAILKGLSIDKSMLMDPFFSNDIKNFLYKSKDENVGSDLIAVNIQRGRDHGIPPYHVYVNYCFGEKIKDWSDLAKFIPVESIGVLQRIYADVKDIDFFTGGMYEKKFPDASLGPTFSCVLGIQYYHLKFGDRYFYSHGYQSGSFTPDQLLNIKETASLAYFLCLTSDNIQSIQLNPFLPTSNSNFEVPCKNFNSINFELFKE